MSVSVNQFLRGVGESGLLSEKEASALRDTLPENARDDSKRLARALVDAGKLTKYQAAAIYQGQPQGLVLGNYVVLDKLGAGGMGQVFKARHTRMDRVVALKVLSRKHTISADAIKRFHREVRAAARLNHPNIVTAYDADEFDGLHYLVMEYVDGQDLASLVEDRGPLPVNEALDYVMQAGRGLQYAHEQGIVHRDIKPGNVLLDRDGTAKVLDMGLAHNRFGEHPDDEAMAKEDLTQTGQIMGTLNYMAPEQAIDTRSADARADIYSLGCTLFRLLTGEVPFHGDTTMKILVAHREDPIPSLRDRRPDVPTALDATFQKMMAKRPDERYQTMAEAVADLEKLFAGEVTLPPPPKSAAPPSPPPISAALPSPPAVDAPLSHVPIPPQPPTAITPTATTGRATAVTAPTHPTAAPARPRTDEQRETIHIDDDTNAQNFKRRISGRRRHRPFVPYLIIGGGVVAVLLLLGLAVVLLGKKQDLTLDGDPAPLTNGTDGLSDLDAPAWDNLPSSSVPNQLTSEERAAGWRLLFDGITSTGWRGYRHTQFASLGNWRVEDGALYCSGTAGPDLITIEEYKDFDLRLQWKISDGGNSGIHYRVNEDTQRMYDSGLEYQVLDDEAYPSRKDTPTATSAINGIVAPQDAKPKPAGEYNDARIVVRGDHVQHWLNGEIVADWNTTQAGGGNLKWNDVGHIGLQNYGRPVWFRSIKIRPLTDAEDTAGH